MNESFIWRQTNILFFYSLMEENVKPCENSYNTK